MLYSLIMLIAINGHTDAYVIDHGLTRSDCVTAMQQQRTHTVYARKGITAMVSLSCERAK